MGTHESSKSIAAAQLVGILAFSLALFFVVAFATKSVDAFRLRSWRNQLKSEIAGMERERAILQSEIEQRKSMAWVDKVLRAAGQVPGGVVRIIIEPAPEEYASAGSSAPTVEDTSSAARTLPLLQSKDSTVRTWGSELFHGPHWEAWQALIWGFDEEGGSYYTPGR